MRDDQRPPLDQCIDQIAADFLVDYPRSAYRALYDSHNTRENGDTQSALYLLFYDYMEERRHLYAYPSDLRLPLGL